MPAIRKFEYIYNRILNSYYDNIISINSVWQNIKQNYYTNQNYYINIFKIEILKLKLLFKILGFV